MFAFRSHALERTQESGERTWIRMRILTSNILRARLELYSLFQTHSFRGMNKSGTCRRTWPALTHESGERTWIRMRILASNILRARLELYSLSQTYECDRVNAFGTRWRTWPALPPCLHFFECELQKLGGMVIEHSLLHVKHESINWHVHGFNNVICVRPQVPAPFSTASFARA